MIDLLVGCRVEKPGNECIDKGLVLRSETIIALGGYPTSSSCVWVLLKNGTVTKWKISEVKVNLEDKIRLFKAIEKFALIDENVEEVKNRFELMDLT